MRNNLDMSEPDPELKAWVEAWIDQRIEPQDALQLTERLRNDPAAKKYCAEVLRFDAAMQDELLPQEIEWTDTRKVTFRNGYDGPGLEVQRNQTVRFGKSGTDFLSTAVALPGNRPNWWMRGLIIAIALTGGLLYWATREKLSVAKIPELVLLNPDFEATDLTFLSEPTNRALVDWQDYFVTENADVAEISRVSEGEVLPKSGRNVARLSNFAYLTQRLRRADGSPLLAKSGLVVIVSGWAYVMEDPAVANTKVAGGGERTHETLGLRGALRFVAGGSPGMIQYEASNASATLTKGGWQHFTIRLTLPQNLLLPASHGVARTNLDLTGKELSLSLDSLCDHGHHLLLDNFAIAEAR